VDKMLSHQTDQSSRGAFGVWGWGGAKWTANTGVGTFSDMPDDNGGVVGASITNSASDVSAA
jgi:hypothetical protein